MKKYYSSIAIKVLLLISTCTQNTSNLTAQNTPIDSLKQILVQKELQEDKVGQCNTLFEIGNQYSKALQDSLALQYYNRGLEIAADSLLHLKGALLYKKSYTLCFLGKDQTALIELDNEALVLLENHPDKSIFFGFLKYYGSLLTSNGKNEEGLNILCKAEKIYSNNKEKIPIDDVLSVYANIIAATDNLNAALEFGRKGIELSKESSSFENKGDLYYNTAHALNAFGFLEEQIRYCKKAIHFFHESKKHQWVAYTQIMLAHVYTEQKYITV